MDQDEEKQLDNPLENDTRDRSTCSKCGMILVNDKCIGCNKPSEECNCPGAEKSE